MKFLCKFKKYTYAETPRKFDEIERDHDDDNDRDGGGTRTTRGHARARNSLAQTPPLRRRGKGRRDAALRPRRGDGRRVWVSRRGGRRLLPRILRVAG